MMAIRRRFRISLPSKLRHNYRLSSSNDKSNNKENGTNKTQETDFIDLPPEPDNCCMSGCENCVWKKYAADLTDMYEDSGEKARKIILEKIKDPSMQVFLKMELEFLDKK